ncbi:MAG: hypothetical protein AABM40_05320 [Chloroflexota bacterium]
MVPLDHRRARSIAPLHVVGKAVLDARIDVELAYASSEERALDRGDEWPHQTLPAVGGIDQHVQKAGTTVGPRWSRDRESNEDRPVPRRHHHRIAVGRLPPHFTGRERARAPLLALELQHSRAEITPGCGVERDSLDRGWHQRLVISTTRASPARSLITRVSPPSEY